MSEGTGNALGSLLDSIDFWRSFADSVPDMVLLVDHEGHIRYINRTPTGVSRDAVLGTSAFTYVGENVRDELRRSLREVFSGAANRTRLERGILPDGTERWFALRAGPVVLEGRIVAAVVIARDITPLKQAEQALAEKDAQTVDDVAERPAEVAEGPETEAPRRRLQKVDALGMLAARIAHDVNNILSIVSASAQLLLPKVQSNEDAKDYLQAIVDAARRGSLLTNHLMRAVRRKNFSVPAIDLNDVIRSVTSVAERSLPPGVEVRLDLDPRGAPVHVKRGLLDQVLVNLLVNARDAIHEKGTITVTTVQEQESTVLRVSDTGIGMTDGTRRRIFDPFFTTKKHIGAAGLGLSTVYSIVGDAGGTIGVTSTLGKGTTFEVAFPTPLRILPKPSGQSS